MTLDNLFTNAPRLLPQRRSKTRSPSHSPARQHAREIDPLLRDLSPSTTLRACVSNPNEMDATNSRALAKSIESASMSERALGAKAARAHLNLRAWTQELENWQWPGAFDPPRSVVESGRNDESDSDTPYWGSLPARTVQSYEARADEIGQHVDELDVEELKQFLLNAHYRVNSRPPSRQDSIGGLSASTDLKTLDDFTALITATILHALPYFTRLNRLIDVWTIRLIILRSTPGYLRELGELRTALDHAWAAIASSSDTDCTAQGRDLDRQSIESSKTSMERQVGSLGRRLDRLLNCLEGGDDSIPDTWIDDFEHLEAAYGTWVVQAERHMLENEWDEQRRQSGLMQAGKATQDNLPTISETEDPASDDDAVRTLSQNVSPWIPQSKWESGSAQNGTTDTSQTSRALGDAEQTSTMPAELPAIGINRQTIPILVTPSDSGDPSSIPPSSNGPSDSVDSAIPEPEMSSIAKKRAAFLNDVIERNQSLKQSKSPVRPFEHASNSFIRLFKNDRSPEQVKPNRSMSNKWRDEDKTRDRNALSPVSIASSKFNSVSGTSSPQAGPSSSKSSVHDLYEPVTSPERSSDFVEVHRPVLEPTARDSSPALSISSPPETYKPTGLSSPFGSPLQTEFPENWPLTSSPPTVLPLDQSWKPEKEEEVQRMDDKDRDSGHEIETPGTPIETDAFDRMFVQSLPNPSIDRPNSARVSERREEPWSVTTHKRPSSLPRAQPQNSETHFPSATADFESGRNTSASRSSLKLHIPEPPFESSTSAVPDDLGDPDEVVFRIKRASVASIGAFSRAQVKSIEVPKSRQHSVSPRVSPPASPQSRQSSVHPPRVDHHVRDDPMQFEQDASSPSPTHDSVELPETSPRLVGDETPIIFHSSPTSTIGDMPKSPMSPTAELSTAMRKRRGKNVPDNETTRPYSPTAFVKAPTTQHKIEGDSFDRHVSEILEALPAPIRFKARPGAETPQDQVRSYSGPRSKTPTMRVPSKGGDLVLAPAESSPKKSKFASEPEVKLYHLTHAGREDPIKLFVRIVGEGERVMVRVGGGWADLADYLRDFANHHGSRTVSEGNLEVQTVTSAPLSRKVSGPAELSRAKSPATPSYSTSRPDSSDSDKNWPTKPLPVDMSSASKQSNNGLSSTPKFTSSGSRPSTANASRPPSRQNTLDVGLSGASSGKKLPEHKAKWVEGMIERAKQASADKSKEDKEKHFSDIGKAGATRRLYFRSSSSGGGGI